MLERIQKAINHQIPVDIFLRIEIDGQPMKCILYYPAFLITDINRDKGTFVGYSLEDRHKRPSEKILTEDLIAAVCNIQSPNLI